MNSMTIRGWKHHDFAPKDFQVLVDGQVVKTVQNARYKNNLLTVRFDPVKGKEVNPKTGGYYSGSPAIRELEIYQQ